jgi:DNA-binding IclR family transcriptional regulator
MESAQSFHKFMADIVVFPLKRKNKDAMLSNVTTKAKVVAKKQPVKVAERVGKYSVPVVRSTFRILQELSRAEFLGLKEITQKTGVSKSTVFRILNTLLEMDYVLRDAGRNYRVSPNLAQLAGEDATGEVLRRLAVPMMLELRNQYGETVNLGVRHFNKVTYLEVVPSEFALRLEERRGASVPVHASALGKAILAFSPANVAQDFVRGGRLNELTRNTISGPEDFLSEIKRVRNAGFAFDRGEGSLLAVCVGAPILDAQGHAVAAMSISGPASRFSPKKNSPVIASLLKTTRELSQALVRSIDRR